MVASLVSSISLSDNLGVFGNIRSLEDMCKHCAPITPVQCISLCRFYRVKNELRNLHNILNNPCYTADFFNVLKNSTRLRIFHILASRRCTLNRVQQELVKVNIKQSQNVISEEHIQLLITVGLVTESLGKYSVTLFGTCIHEFLCGFDVFLQNLPPQSKCHEETLIQALLLGPKTCEEIHNLLSHAIASRIIKRLTDAQLVNAPANRNYIFFHKSKRDPTLEKLTLSEMKTYQAIPAEGIAADKLAKLVKLSPRRTYAHIRRLKGKKLVFTKKILPTYSLTEKGQKLAYILHNLTQKIIETRTFTQYITQQTDLSYLTTSTYFIGDKNFG